MKKSAALLLIALLLTLTACGGKGAVSTASDTSAVTESAVSATSESEPTAAESEPTETTASDPTEATSQAASTAPAQSNAGGGSTSAASKPSSTPSTTTPPVTSQPVTPSEPAQPDPPKPAFNAQTYYDYALSYGQSIGLIYYSELNTTEGTAWNAPANLYASLTDETMKQSIRSRLDLIKREDNTHFGLFLEKQSDGSYRLYVPYA